jgi:hypothetical protein
VSPAGEALAAWAELDGTTFRILASRYSVR